VSAFEIICEIEPATRPDLTRVRHQIGVLAPVADAFLVPDNHIGRATVSSIAVAHEVDAMGARAIACLNARDRNVLGMRRDLLTAAAYGVDEFLCVYGDQPAAGARVAQLSVRDMMREVRTFETGRAFRVGVTSGLRPIPVWKHDADFCFVQIGFDLDALFRWRDEVSFTDAIYAGVIVLPSAAMARKLGADIAEARVPDAILERLETDRTAGVELSCDLIDAVRDHGGFAGVHLIPVSRYRETAAALEARRR
jgi:5,10-methylenetetrahydrofolate reductase